MFKRKIYDKLLAWKAESDGHTALLIEGARRIGKSTVVEAFAQNEYESYILIDFSIASKAVRELFEDISDLNYFFLQLQLQYHVDLVERKSLIIFDEVQLCPLARQAIKHLVKDHRYDYIETGSLISIKRNVKSILIPSEERRINMYPMDYEEFLWAIGDQASYGLTKKCFEQGMSLGQQTNRKLLRTFRLYMLVGGMPQAVSEYLKTNNFRKELLVHICAKWGFVLSGANHGQSPQKIPISALNYKISLMSNLILIVRMQSGVRILPTSGQ